MGNEHLAPTPPLGWNSWDCYGMAITEAELLDNARAMKEKLSPFGFRYLVMDAGWFNPRPELAKQSETPEVVLDDFGRLIPALNRFPSSAGGAGLRNVARATHDLGLRLGVHMMRGIPRAAVERNTPILGSPQRARDIADLNSTCSWNQEMYGVNLAKPGAQEYYDSVAKLFAEWELDFIKADDLSAPYYAAEIAALSKALRHSGRDILLSLSPGGLLSDESVGHAREFSEMRRVSKDLWDAWVDEDPNYAGLKQQFDVARAWQGLGGPGHWPDLDMLPLGRISLNGTHGPARQARYTPDEQITMLTLWAVFQSPLMLGGELRTLPDDIVQRLCNPELIEVNQRGRNGRELWRADERVVWRAELPSSEVALALFNLGDRPAPVEVSALQVPELRAANARDLWRHTDLAPSNGGLCVEVPAHGARLLRIVPRLG